MLSEVENQLLTQTGPGTPMGAFVRRFWMPFLLSEELAELDGPPVRVRLLGKDLIAFRATDGSVGLVDAFCPHRRAPMFFGRNEECGLRCVYHGWKFDASGACVDMPSEPPDSLFKTKVSITAYPVRDAHGVLWAYLGPPGAAGELPHMVWMDQPHEYRFMGRWLQRSNFVQAIEGELDSSHLSSLHQPLVPDPKLPPTAGFGKYVREDTSPTWTIRERPYGLSATARRRADDTRAYYRTNQFLLPFGSLIAPDHGRARMMRFWVPRDDETTLVIAINYHEDRPISEDEAAGYRAGEYGFCVVRPGTHWPVPGPDNDYLMNREVQRTKTTTGIPGVRVQDLAMVEGMGPCVDRRFEHLGTSDTAIIAMRRTLLDGARALANDTSPVGAAGGDLYRVRSWSAVLTDAEFAERADELQQPAIAGAGSR
jgi:phthalate 4,5-dioxygenase oxygenase subunit